MKGYKELNHLLGILRSRGIGFDELKKLNPDSPKIKKLISKTRVDRLSGLSEEEIQQLAREVINQIKAAEPPE